MFILIECRDDMDKKECNIRLYTIFTMYIFYEIVQTHNLSYNNNGYVIAFILFNVIKLEFFCIN